MKTENFPQIVIDDAIRVFPNGLYKLRHTVKNTIMAYNNQITLYYIMNDDNTQIIDVQVD